MTYTFALSPKENKQYDLVIESQTKKCSICNMKNVLMKLPEEFQEYAGKKGFISYYCCSCCQVVNFLLS